MNRNFFKWLVRVLAVITFVFGIMFYFGYGTFEEHIPWINEGYSLWDNIWLTVFPIMFFGLALGLFKPLIGGVILFASVFIGLASAFILEREIVSFMGIPMIIGILYIIEGSKKDKR